MALSNLSAWSGVPGSACGAPDKPTACGAPDKPTACGAPDKPTACGSACGAGDKK